MHCACGRKKPTKITSFLLDTSHASSRERVARVATDFVHRTDDRLPGLVVAMLLHSSVVPIVPLPFMILIYCMKPSQVMTVTVNSDYIEN